MSSAWVSEFESTTDGGRSVEGKSHKRALSRKEKIQEELKLLEWHKMANEAALKAALLQTKNLKSHVPEHLPVHTVDDARWIKKVIEQEHIKPLEVSKDYVLEYERREKENQERLAAQVERHISTLKTLREKLETRAELKSRTDEYRQWQRDFSTKKQAVMIGKTLEEIEAELCAEKDQDLANGRSSLSPLKKKQPQVAATGNAQDLSNVLDSLNKLAELESRITSLEKDNVYERMLQQERPAVNDRTVMDFRKARVSLPEKGPVAVTYAMRPMKASWQVKVPAQSGGVAVGAGSALARTRQNKFQQMALGDCSDEVGGTFITGYDGGGMDPEDRKRERLRQQALAPPGQKALRGRLQNKKGRVKEVAVGSRRHEEAMRELNRRRNEQQIQKRPPRQVAGLMGNHRGAGAGIKTKNKHLHDFEKLKTGFKKRRDEVLGHNPRMVGLAGGGGLAAIRAVSQTAPTHINSRNINASAITGNRVGGGLTRRTDAPARRPPGGNLIKAPSTAPVALGIGGVKMLREQRNYAH